MAAENGKAITPMHTAVDGRAAPQQRYEALFTDGSLAGAGAAEPTPRSTWCQRSAEAAVVAARWERRGVLGRLVRTDSRSAEGR